MWAKANNPFTNLKKATLGCWLESKKVRLPVCLSLTSLLSSLSSSLKSCCTCLFSGPSSTKRESVKLSLIYKKKITILSWKQTTRTNLEFKDHWDLKVSAFVCHTRHIDLFVSVIVMWLLWIWNNLLKNKSCKIKETNQYCFLKMDHF